MQLVDRLIGRTSWPEDLVTHLGLVAPASLSQAQGRGHTVRKRILAPYPVPLFGCVSCVMLAV
jgi:hypothetical protein